MATCDKDALIESACENGFLCIANSPRRANAAVAQLLCNFLSPPENLVPEGSSYAGNFFAIPIAQGAQIVVVWGANEDYISDFPQEYPNTGAGTSTVFTVTNAGGFIVLRSDSEASLPVTAAVYLAQGSCVSAVLLAQACSNGFHCQGEQVQNALMMQLLCNLSTN